MVTRPITFRQCFHSLDVAERDWQPVNSALVGCPIFVPHFAATIFIFSCPAMAATVSTRALKPWHARFPAEVTSRAAAGSITLNLRRERPVLCRARGGVLDCPGNLRVRCVTIYQGLKTDKDYRHMAEYAAAVCQSQYAASGPLLTWCPDIGGCFEGILRRVVSSSHVCNCRNSCCLADSKKMDKVDLAPKLSI